MRFGLRIPNETPEIVCFGKTPHPFYRLLETFLLHREIGDHLRNLLVCVFIIRRGNGILLVRIFFFDKDYERFEAYRHLSSFA